MKSTQIFLPFTLAAAFTLSFSAGCSKTPGDVGDTPESVPASAPAPAENDAVSSAETVSGTPSAAPESLEMNSVQSSESLDDTPEVSPEELPAELPSELPADVPAVLPTDSSSPDSGMDAPSDASSDAPSGTSSEVPSEIPSELPAETPSESQSESQSLSESQAVSEEHSFSESQATAGIEMEIRSPGDAAPTSYAPVEVLAAQMALAETELAACFTDEAVYGEKAAEVRRLASVVAVFAQVLGLHDQYSTYKDGTTEIIEAAGALASAEGYAPAKECWEKLKIALKSKESKNLSWSVSVAKLPELMRSVAVYNGEIQGKVEKFRGLDAAAGRAVALAALFQGLTANSAETCAPDRAGAWQEFCMKSRDASYYLYITLDARDKKYSHKNLETLENSCAACHAEFKTAK